MNSSPAFANSYRIVIWLILVLLLPFLSCEKDDICVDGDTPLLIVRFYDAAEPGSLKQANGLRVIGIGNGNPVDTFADRSTTDSIGIPLRLDDNVTSFVFILDSADENEMETGNPDTLSFQYEVGSQFISRACGFIGTYDSIQQTITPDSENWISSVEITRAFVQFSDSTHVKIFH